MCIYIYINIPGVSTTLRFWGRLQNTSFLGTFDTSWGRFMQKRHFIFQAGAGYIISITKLNHVSVLCLSCLMLDQAPSHIIQTLSTCKIFACFLEWAAGADICTLWNLCGIYTGFEHIHSPWSCGASCWSSFDGWTDGRTDVKKDAFFF